MLKGLSVMDPGIPTVPKPWHEGERRLQASLGVVERMAVSGPRGIRNFMPEQHRQFFAQLPFLVFGSVDAAGDAWATLLSGEPGFAHAPDPKQLDIGCALSPDDPATPGFADGSAVGMLGIELHTRRRNRLNGRVIRRDTNGFSLAVEHSFGNCPQYIRLRDIEQRGPDRGGMAVRGDSLTSRARAMIESAETFFVASYTDATDTGRQVDVSHRGGKAGFVRVGADDLLTIPDFAGNLHFNTLGNFLLTPKAGLVFVDFEIGDLLQLTGAVSLILDSPEISAFQGAQRLWTFRPEAMVLREAALDWCWTARKDGHSPSLLATGSWTEVAQSQAAANPDDV